MESTDVSTETKVRLKTAYIAIDPLDLLQRLRVCQDRLWAMAVAPPSARVSRQIAQSPPTAAAPVPESSSGALVPLRDPSLSTVAAATGDVHWRKARRPHKRSGKPRTWRTREDPFELVWDDIVAMLNVTLNQSAKTILTALQGRYPGVFPNAQLRTLQRQVHCWRVRQTLVEIPADGVLGLPLMTSAADVTPSQKLAASV